MTESDAPHITHIQAPVQPPVTAAPTPSSEAEPKKLSTFLKVSIALLIGLTIASISLVFIGDFQGKFERVFSTFALFAVFVVFTAIDTSRDRKSDWYAPVALIANTYILGLLLVVIWMTPYTSYGLIFEIFWKSVLVIVVTRLVILLCELLLRAGERSGETTTKFAFVTSVLAVLSGILFTAPVGIQAFSLHVPELYWKLATAVLILTALGLSITLLLGWAHGADDRAKRRAEAAQRVPAFPVPQPPAAPHAPAETPVAVAPPAPPVARPESDPVLNELGMHDDPELLPWPTFADGRPIPAGPDGQPDFSVPGAPEPPKF